MPLLLFGADTCFSALSFPMGARSLAFYDYKLRYDQIAVYRGIFRRLTCIGAPTTDF